MEINEFFNGQLAQWPEARQRYDDLAKVQTKTFVKNGLRVQWNPARMVSTGAKIDVKSLEKRQNELVQKLFPEGNGGYGVNATRLVVRALELRIIDIDNLQADEQ